MDQFPKPYGRRGPGPLGGELRIERHLDATVAEVWAALTESHRLSQWIGRWEGDPDSGHVTFYMTAEGDDVAPEERHIIECSPPHRLLVDLSLGDESWHLKCEVHEGDGTTTLLFVQDVGTGSLEDIGPGWEYYLERLARLLSDRDVSKVNWDDYYPQMCRYYTSGSR